MYFNLKTWLHERQKSNANLLNLLKFANWILNLYVDNHEVSTLKIPNSNIHKNFEKKKLLETLFP